MTTNLLTTAEVAKRVDRDRSVILRLVEAGRLTPAMKLPGKTGAHLFDPVEVDRLAAELDDDPDEDAA